MDDQNPFKKVLPVEENEFPKEEIWDEVMGTLHVKSYLFSMLEFFTSIFGKYPVHRDLANSKDELDESS